MGIVQRIGAGIGAASAAAGGAVSPLANIENNYDHPPLSNDISAVVQKMPENTGPRSLTDIADEFSNDQFKVNVPEEFQESQPAKLQEPLEQKTSEPNTAQNIGELGKNINDISGAAADVKKGKDEADEALETETALNNQYRNAPAQGGVSEQDALLEQTTKPKQEALPEQTALNNNDYSPNNNTSSGNDNGNDYYNGYGY